jgi:hypothetical protein
MGFILLTHKYLKQFAMKDPAGYQKPAKTGEFAMKELRAIY